MLRIQLPESVKTRKSKIICQRKGWNRPLILSYSVYDSLLSLLCFGGKTFERKLKRQISFCFIGTLKDEFKRLFNRKIMKVFRHNSVWFHLLCRTVVVRWDLIENHFKLCSKTVTCWKRSILWKTTSSKTQTGNFHWCSSRFTID